MRFYSFGNMYLSSIQQGIQAAHVVTEMFIKYEKRKSTHVGNEEIPLLYEWAYDHKTMILLNGGMSDNLHSLNSFFKHDDNPYPFASFKESKEALDGAATSVGIVLPEKIYEGAALLRRRLTPIMQDKFIAANTLMFYDEHELAIEERYNDFEIELMYQLNKYRLAQ